MLKELDEKKASKKSKSSKEVDYDEMDFDDLVELAEEAGIEDADDYSKKSLIRKLNALAEKKSSRSKSDDTPDFGEGDTDRYGYSDDDNDEEPAFPEWRGKFPAKEVARTSL